MRTQIKVILGSLGFLASLMGCAENSATPKLIPASVITPPQYSQKPGGSDYEIFRPKVDILFVIDNSGSMSSVQQALAANVKAFADEMAKVSYLDFHIGVVTTDMDNCSTDMRPARCGKLVGYIPFVDRSTPNMSAILANNMVVGTNGSATEVMFTPVVAALTPPQENTTNKGFYRPGAFLAVIMITDANEQSDMSPMAFLDFLANKKGDPRRVFGYGVIRKMADNGCSSNGEDVDDRLETFLGAVSNGDKSQKNILSLCDPRFGPKLAEFGKDIVERTSGSIRLTRVPVPGTIRVFYGIQELANDALKGWVYSPATNSIQLGPQIKWDFEQGGNPQLTIDFKVLEADPTRRD